MEVGALIIILLVGIVIILTFYIIGVYNKLLDAKNKVEDKFRQIDIEIDKKIDLITTLVNIVKEKTKYEDKVINDVITAGERIVNARNINERINSFKEFNKSLNKLFSLSENYSELKKSRNFIKIQKSFNESDDKINYASSFYNDTVLEYNNLIKEYPYKIISTLFGFIEIENIK